MTLEAAKSKYVLAAQETEKQIAQLQLQAQRLHGAIAAVEELIQSQFDLPSEPVNPITAEH